MEVFSDSRLVVGQVVGELEDRDLRMQEYLNQVRHLQSGFESFTLLKIARSRNMHVDSFPLSKPSWGKAYLELFLLRTYVNLLI